MKSRVAFVFALVLSLPLSAQENPPSETVEAAEPARKLRIISEGQTLNYIPKFDGSGPTGLTDSILFENNGKVGINTSDPKVLLHLFGGATSDVAAGFGPDPTYLVGPAFNIGYSGNSYGRSSGFLNVRADALAVAPNPSLRFATADVQRMIITNTGAVGIGTTLPLAPLHLNKANSQSQLYITNNTLYTGLLSALSYSSDNVSLGFDVDWSTATGWKARASTVAWLYKSGGHFKLQGSGGNTVDGMAVANVYQDTDLTTGVTVFRSLEDNDNSARISGGMVHLTGYPTQLKFGNNQFIQDNGTGNMRIFAGANLTVDTNAGGDITMSPGSSNFRVTGNVVVTGNITGAKVLGAVYQDLAEWVPASSDMTPGTVVVLNLGKTNEVMPSSREYDTAVAGVVSAAPGIILGVEGESKEQIATTGRVKVRVDARDKPILVGDLLVTSATPGTAMRSEPMSINGRAFHQPGTIIGKALEPLESGIGEILVLLSMQ